LLQRKTCGIPADAGIQWIDDSLVVGK